MKKKELNRAVIGCGVIANEMAQGFEKMGRTLYSVADNCRIWRRLCKRAIPPCFICRSPAK